MKKIITLTTVLLISSHAYAAKVYTCNIGGITTYTSRPAPSCQSASLPEIGSYTSTRVPRSQLPSEPVITHSAPTRTATRTVSRTPTAPIRTAPAIATAPAAPIRTAATGGRRTILEQELSNEQRALASAQSELSAARAKGNQARASQLAGNVMDRQQNIEALQRELSRM